MESFERLFTEQREQRPCREPFTFYFHFLLTTGVSSRRRMFEQFALRMTTSSISRRNKTTHGGSVRGNNPSSPEEDRNAVHLVCSLPQFIRRRRNGTKHLGGRRHSQRAQYEAARRRVQVARGLGRKEKLNHHLSCNFMIKKLI